MKKGVRVYWVNSLRGTVGSDLAVRFTATRVEFADGGWNPRESTYLTESQARKVARLPEPQSAIERAAQKASTLIDRASELLGDALEKTNGTKKSK